MNFRTPLFCLLFLLSTPAVVSANAITVTDYSGAVITLDKPAKRIVSLAPHITENIFSAGAGELLVGVMAYSDYPEAAKKLPIVGSAHGVSIEKVISLSPDLIIAWSSGVSEKVLSSLKGFGIPVYLDEPKTLENIAKSIEDIGHLADRSSISKAVVNRYLRELTILRDQYSGRRAVSVLYQVWHEPLMTLNGSHIVSDVIRLCGGRNSFADAAVIAPQISIESVLAHDPDTIITSGVGDELPASLRLWEAWPQLSAVKNEHLFLMPPDILQRHSIRLLQAAEILCEHLQQVRNILK